MTKPKDLGWDDLKKIGSDHYKTGLVEPIDLLRSIKPNPDYNSFDIKALGDCIKYASRLLRRGYLKADADKIIHYMMLFIADRESL
jgi:hypothetical protein